MIKVPCLQCGMKFTSNTWLKKHHERIHEKKLYSCEQCNKMLSDRRNLERHKKNVHEDSSNINCDVCGTCFKRKDNLKAHKKEITKKCDLCLKTFSSLTGLAEHRLSCSHVGFQSDEAMKRQHNGILRIVALSVRKKR